MHAKYTQISWLGNLGHINEQLKKKVKHFGEGGAIRTQDICPHTVPKSL